MAGNGRTPEHLKLVSLPAVLVHEQSRDQIISGNKARLKLERDATRARWAAAVAEQKSRKRRKQVMIEATREIAEPDREVDSDQTPDLNPGWHLSDIPLHLKLVGMRLLHINSKNPAGSD